MIGCDPTVDVFQPPAEPRYSLHGWLDVAADTQAIRVEPLGDPSPLGAPNAFDATVLLEDLGADTTVALRDSFHTANPDAYRDPTQVHTFWTTHPIRPSTTYRVRVQRDGNTITYATTTTPDQPPDLSSSGAAEPTCGIRRDNSGPYVLVEAFSVDKLAAARAIYPVTRRGRFGTPYTSRYEFGHTETVTREDGHFDIHIYYASDAFDMPVCISRETVIGSSIVVKVAAGGPGWPRWRGVPLDEIARTDTYSNVERGVGFVGGVHSDTIHVPVVEQ